MTSSPVIPDQAVWGAGVRLLRELAGLTQTELAERAGLEQTQISGVERGARRISDTVRVRIARALDVDPHQLFPYLDEDGNVA